MLVYKYGGSSVSSIERILKISEHIKEIAKNEKIIVVVSAMGKTTNNLIDKAMQISKKPNSRELDRLMSIGEIESISLLSIALNSMNVKAISLTAEQIPIKSTGSHTKSRIKSIDKSVLEKYINEYDVLVVAGFQAINENNEITTLGRGGSDTTAVALASLLKVDCHIYTDVYGIYTLDPRIYENARKIEKISYDEMMELAYLGAGVMEARAVELGYKYSTNIYVKKTLSSDCGTLICSKEEIMEEKEITGISVNNNTLMVTIDNIATYAKNLEPIFTKANEYGINIDIISHNDVISENGSIAFIVQRTELEAVKTLFSELDLKSNVLINDKISKVSLVGIGMINRVGIISKIFKILATNNISFHQISSSELSISIVVEEENAVKLAQTLAKEFNL